MALPLLEVEKEEEGRVTGDNRAIYGQPKVIYPPSSPACKCKCQQCRLGTQPWGFILQLRHLEQLARCKEI